MDQHKNVHHLEVGGNINQFVYICISICIYFCIPIWINIFIYIVVHLLISVFLLLFNFGFVYICVWGERKEESLGSSLLSPQCDFLWTGPPVECWVRERSLLKNIYWPVTTLFSYAVIDLFTSTWTNQSAAHNKLMSSIVDSVWEWFLTACHLFS